MLIIQVSLAWALLGAASERSPLANPAQVARQERGPAFSDWPQWRGPRRDGHAVHVKLPQRWPEESLPLVWKIPVGNGYSSPVIVDGLVYVHSRREEQEVVICLDAATGDRRWEYAYPAPYQMHPAAINHGPGPKATTTIADGKVFAYGISSILTCLDAAGGKRLWQLDLKDAFDAEPAEYGTAGSPLVEGNLVVVPVGGKRGGAVMAFDQADGHMVWKAVPGELPAMNSPVVADLAGVRQVLTFTEKQLVGLDLHTGQVLWSYPFSTAYRQNIVTPVVAGDLVIASGTGKFTFALRIRRQGEPLIAEEVWRNGRLSMYMSSPVVVGPALYGHNWRGELVCVDLLIGKTDWARGSFGEYCSMIVAGDVLLVLDNQGMLSVIQADPVEFRDRARLQVSDRATWSHLAIVESRIYVRDSEELRCLQLP